MKPTLDAYTEWQAAFDFYNQKLFAGELPECLIILDNKGKGVLGYFSSERFYSGPRNQDQ